MTKKVPTGKSLRVGVYLRISRDAEGKSLGVERQREDCVAKAEALGWQVVSEYCENDVSASTISKKPRPQYERMLADVRSGRLDAVLAYSNGRLTRRPLEWIGLIELFEQTRRQADEGHRAQPVVIDTVVSGKANFSTADGRAVALTVSVWDGAEVERIQERVLRKHLQLRNSGAMVGARTFGWRYEQIDTRTDLRTGEEKPVYRTLPELNPEEAALLRDAVARILSGGSPARIAQEWNEAGITTTWGKHWHHGNLRTLLKNPKIAGLRAHKKQVVRDESGEPVRGQWEPIIDVPTWVRLCSVLDRKKHHRAGATKHLLGGIVRCECGAPMWGWASRDYRTQKPRVNYSCRKCRCAISQSKLHPLVLSAMASSVLFGQDGGSGTGEPQTVLYERLTALRARETRLLDLVDAEVFSVAEIAAKRAAISAESEEVERELDALTAHDVLDEALSRARRELWSGKKVSITDAARVKAQIRERFDSLDFDTQQTMLRGSLDITVRRVGKGSKAERVSIRHLVATGLNEDAQPVDVA